LLNTPQQDLNKTLEKDRFIKKRIKSIFKVQSTELLSPFYLWIGLAVLTLFTLLPFLYLFVSSISTNKELIKGHLIPKNPTLENYKNVLFSSDGGFLQSLGNSITVSLLTTVFTMVIAFIAAYAFSRIKFPFRTTTLFGILSLQILPSISILIPMYMMMRNGIQINIPFTNVVLFQSPPLLDTVWGLTISHITFALPFAIWLLTGYLQTIPKELEEAAYVDGCSRLRTMFSIVMPLAMPGIAATSIFVALLSWDEFLFANALTQTYESKTLPITIVEFIGKHSLDWGSLTAGGFIASLPPVVFALFFFRYIVGGLTSGGVKE
jgi:multiple sugar transport system permease protein